MSSLLVGLAAFFTPSVIYVLALVVLDANLSRTGNTIFGGALVVYSCLLAYTFYVAFGAVT